MKKYYKIFILLILLILIMVLNHVFNISEYFVGENSTEYLKSMLENNYLIAVLIYLALTIFSCVILALPGITFAIIAGAVFGPYVGTFLCVLATTIGAILSFIVGRFFLKDGLKDKIIKNKYIKKYLFDETGNNGIVVLMITRLIPLFPFNLQNFAYGITDMRIGLYTIGTFIFIIPGTAMYTFAAAGITNTQNRMMYIVIAVIIAIVTILISKILKRKYVN